MTLAGDATPPATPGADHQSVSHGQQAIVPDVAPQANTTGLNTVSVSFPSAEHSSTLAIVNTLAVPSTSSAIATSPMTRLSVAHKLQGPLLAQRAISTISTASDATSLSLNTEYKGPIIPPACDKEYCDARTLVICFDGTGDEFDQDNSNVVKFFSLLKKGDHNRQLCYYQVCDTPFACRSNSYKFLPDLLLLLAPTVIFTTSITNQLNANSPVLVHTLFPKLLLRYTRPTPKHST